MTLYASISMALATRETPLSGRDVAASAGIGYKQAIDALGRMHDAGTVVRFGRKYSSTWALSGTSAAVRTDPLQGIEAAWRASAGAPDPHPHGGEAETHPPARVSS